MLMSVGAGRAELELAVVEVVPPDVVVDVVPVEVVPLVEFEDPPVTPPVAQELAPLPAQADCALTEEPPPPPQPTRASERTVQRVRLLFIRRLVVARCAGLFVAAQLDRQPGL
jgi:hypothetical protein